MTTISFDKYYGLAVLSAFGVGVQCFLTPMFTTIPERKRYFNNAFMEREFGDQHRKEIGLPPPPLGYPDQGFGRFSDKLSYKEWYLFNCAQRAHGNFVEHIGIVIPLILIGGLRHGGWAAGFGLTYFIGRVLYSVGYAGEKGDERSIGGTIISLSMFGLIALAACSCWKLVKPLVK